jgi:uncharacterized protein YjbI with pentapeptide repeats
VSEGSKPPKKDDAAGETPAKPARPPRKSVPFEDETMVGLTPIKPDAPEEKPADEKKPTDDPTMMHVASAPRPARGKYDEETERALRPLEETPSESKEPPRRFVDETMLVIGAPIPAAPIEEPIPPPIEPAAQPDSFETAQPPAVVESVLEVPIAEPTFPPAAPVTRPTARFDPTMTSGLTPIVDLLETPAPAPKVPVDPTRTSFLSPITFDELEAKPAPVVPPEPRGTVEAIAAALAKKHRLDEPAPPLLKEEAPAAPLPQAKADWAHEPEGRAPPPVEERRELPATQTPTPAVRRGRRVGDVLPIVHQTKFTPFVMSWRLRPPRDAIVVVVKATARYAPGAAAELIEGTGPSGDVFSGEGTSGSLRYASDFAVFKPRADVMLEADAHAPPGGSVASVRFRIGPHAWHLAAIGNRLWGGSTPTRAEPFETMPLTWEHALGGTLSTENPVGRGYKTGTLLPNLERPEQLIAGKRDTPRPVCFAPVSPTWRSRASKVGRYDGKWLKARWPFLPEDFDFAYFNAAPVDLQVPYLKGDELFDVTGVMPGGAVLDGRLPGVRPYVYAQKSSRAGGELLALHMNLDTVLVDAKTQTLTLVWRGLLEVADRDALDLAALYIEEGPLNAQANLEAVLGRFHALLATRRRVATEVGDTSEAANDATLLAPMGTTPAIDTAKRARRPLPPSRTPRLPRRRRPPRIVVASKEALTEWLAEGRSFAGVDLSGVDFRDVDLRGRDLTGAILIDALLDGASFDGATCTGMIACRASAAETTFVGADLTGADLSDMKASRADFSDAKMTRVIARRLSAEGAKFLRVAAEGVVLAEAKLDDASFLDAVLPKADFSSSKLNRVRFERAKLPDAKLYDVEGGQVVLDGADLTDARIEMARLVGLSARAVAAPGSVWDKSDVSDATFEGAQLQDASFGAATALRALFNKIAGERAVFRGADLRQACFLKSTLGKASFEQANLAGADLRGALLEGAETWEATIEGTDFRHASLTGTKLARSQS